MKLAVVGLGFMGSTHLKAIRNIPLAELVAVASDDPVKLAGDLSAIQGNIGGPGEKLDFSNLRKYRKWEECLRDRDIEAVDLCLPTHLHADAAIEALRSGKHVLVEKPMALTAEQVDAMVAEARENNRVLMVAQVLRFWNTYVVLEDLVKCGKLGAIRSAIFRRRCAAPGWGKWISDPSKSGGGVFDLLIHDVDMVLHLFGMPESVSATGHEDMSNGIDTILAELFYPGICTVAIQGGWHLPKAYPFNMDYTVVGDAGAVEYSSAYRAPTLYAADGSSHELPLPEKDGYQGEIEYFLECAKANRRPELCPPEQSAAAVKLTLLMLEARARKGERIRLGEI